MIHRGTYDGTIYHNPANKFCIISVKTADKDVPQEARSTRRHKDHLIRFVATGYELPRTDAVELELDGEWKKGKYGMQLQVEQWHEIVPQTKSGVEGYSFLKKWIYKPGIEEVNINAYNDIEVIEAGGRSVKIPDKFSSPQHAIDVVRRMLNACGMVIDDSLRRS